MNIEAIKAFWRNNKHVRDFMAAAGTVLILGLCWAGWYVFHHESTDDAYIEGHVIPVSPKVSGHIAKVYFTENQEVKAGDSLCDIDDRDYRVRLNLAEAESKAAQVEAAQAGQDAERYQKLHTTGDVSQQQYDHVIEKWQTAQARLEAAQARLQQAGLNVSYTKILAPESGRITRKAVEAGAFVQEGQALLALVPPERWVIANFKETQLTHMRPGQKVAIQVDAYPGVTFHGHVDSIQQGTGARFSLLPAENATGNFIKVVQRVPVKIVFDEAPNPDKPLALGMSVVPTVTLK